MAEKKINRGSRERGFVAMAYAVMIVGMLGFAGLAVDVGFMQYEKRRVQAAADAAAMGALRELELGHTDLSTAGQSDAALNGFTDGSNDATVTINNPPISGGYANNSAAIEAIVTKKVPSFFMMIFGQNGNTITGRAVARTSPAEGSIGGCIFAMNPTVSGALTVDGTASITTACGAVVNSTSSSAFTMVGNSSISLINQGGNTTVVGVVGPGGTGTKLGSGGWSLSGGAQILNGGKAVSPINILAFSAPLASACAPSATYPGLNLIRNRSTTVSPSSTVTLNPGIYCGGIDIKGTATLSQGVYVLAGGGLTIDSQAVVNNTGNGVTFYNTTGSFSPSCGNTGAGSFTFNGGASIKLTAYNTGSTSGILFYDDRTVMGLSHIINGNSTSTFDGALYFLHGNLKFAGTNASGKFLYIVADTIEFTGTSNLSNDKSYLTNVYTLAPSSTGGGLVE